MPKVSIALKINWVLLYIMKCSYMFTVRDLRSKWSGVNLKNFEIEIFIYIDKHKFDMENINYFEFCLVLELKFVILLKTQSSKREIMIFN